MTSSEEVHGISADSGITTTIAKSTTSSHSYGYVVLTATEIFSSAATYRHIAESRCLVGRCLESDGYVKSAVGVGPQRTLAYGSVAATSGIITHRESTDCGVTDTTLAQS
jgi:hypothetical protein